MLRGCAKVVERIVSKNAKTRMLRLFINDLLRFASQRGATFYLIGARQTSNKFRAKLSGGSDDQRKIAVALKNRRYASLNKTVATPILTAVQHSER